MAARPSLDSETSETGEDAALRDMKYNTETPAYGEMRRFREKNQQQKHRRCMAIALAIFAIGGSVSLVLQTLILLRPHPGSPLPSIHVADVYRPDTLSPGLNLCDCGENTREALATGCVYDSLAAAWLPPYCRDDELTAEFDHAGPGPDGAWPYFADEQGKIPIDKAQLAALGDTEGAFWCTHEWHVAHCLFYWEKYWRMRDTGVVMERRFDYREHIHHCRHLALKTQPQHTMLIKVNVLMNSRLT